MIKLEVNNFALIIKLELIDVAIIKMIQLGFHNLFVIDDDDVLNHLEALNSRHLLFGL